MEKRIPMKSMLASKGRYKKFFLLSILVITYSFSSNSTISPMIQFILLFLTFRVPLSLHS